MLNLNTLKKLYTGAPLWVQKAYAAIPFDIRNGAEYRKWQEFLNKEINIEEYELLKIKESVLYAYKNTRYYKNLFTNLDISPYDIKSKQDFQKIPFVDKKIVAKNYNDFLVTGFPNKQKLMVTTGGSSGTPMKFTQSKNIWAKEQAFYINFLAGSGYNPSMIKVAFRGANFTKLKKNIYWIENPVNNEVIFSPSHLNEENISKYISKLNKIKPKLLHGFPSAFLFLMYNIKKKNLKLNFKIETIFLVSEAFTKEDIKQISTYYGCKVISAYGHSERLILAESTGEVVSGYKINKKYGFFELIKENNNIEVNNLKGEIIGTGFDNLAMPILRYKTGDFTSYFDVDNGIINLVDSPRDQVYIDCNDNSRISVPSLIKASEMLELGILKYQIIQEKIGKIKLIIIPNKIFNESNKSELTLSINSRINDRLSFEVVIVNELFLTTRGKCKLLIKEYT